MHPKPDYSTWYPKQQAAELIGVSTKQIERWAQEGKLQTAKWRRPGGGPMIAVYHPAEVDQLGASRNPGAKPFVLPAQPVTVPASMKPMNGDARQGFTEQLAQAIAIASQTVADMPKVRLAERLYLTIPEASEYTGLSISFLRVLTAEHGSLPITKGAGRHGADVVKRSDLDNLG